MEIKRIAGKLPEYLRAEYEWFMDFDRREAQIAKLYEFNSVTLVVFDHAIIGTARMIIKRNVFEKIPCEFGRMKLIDFDYTLDHLPVMEAAYLKVEKSLSLRLRSYILKMLCDSVFNLGIEYNVKIAFLSCDPDTSLERLYERFYGVKSIGCVSYETKTYTLMARYHPSLIKEKAYA